MSRSRIVFVLLCLLLAAAWIGWHHFTSGGRERGERGSPLAAPVESAGAESAPLAPPPEPQPAAPALAKGREAVETSAASGSAPLASEGTLSVRVRTIETDERIYAMEVVVHEAQAGWGSKNPLEARGRAGELLATDDQGRVECACPVGQALVLEVNPQKDWRAGWFRQEVPAVAPGERRELVVRLPTEADATWFGRIVDDASGAALGGASMACVEDNPFGDVVRSTATSEADGLARLAFCSWRGNGARAELEGYATSEVRLEPGHEGPATAHEVRLLQAATLDLLATDARSGVPLEGLLVRVRGAARRVTGPPAAPRLGPEPPLETRTEKDGHGVLAGLAPGVPFALELCDGETLLRYQDDVPPLAPGEARVVAWGVGGCTLEGTVHEADGSPAAGVSVALLADDGSPVLHGERDEQVLVTATSDARGRFAMELTPGKWLLELGRSPDDEDPERAEPEPRERAIAAASTALVIEPGQERASVSLTCWRGLFLSGTVRGPDGVAVAFGNVNALHDGVFAHARFLAGPFSIGPLAPGEYRVWAESYGGSLAESESVTASAGTAGLELVLRHPAQAVVRVQDASGRPARAMVWVLPEHAESSNSGETGPEGRIEFHRLPPGTYNVSASTQSGGFALARGVSFDAGVAPREIELRLAPAAPLRVEILPRAGETMTALVELDGWPILPVLLQQSPLVALPPGTYDVVLMTLRGTQLEELQRQRVRVAPAGETRVVFDLSAPR